SSQLGRQTEACNGKYLIESFEQAAGYAGRFVFQALREIANQSLGLRGIVELPGLAQRAAHRSVQSLLQPRHNVAGPVNLAALDRRLASETAPDRPRQRLRAVDDEQPWNSRIKPARN